MDSAALASFFVVLARGCEQCRLRITGMVRDSNGRMSL